MYSEKYNYVNNYPSAKCGIMFVFVNICKIISFCVGQRVSCGLRFGTIRSIKQMFSYIFGGIDWNINRPTIFVDISMMKKTGKIPQPDKKIENRRNIFYFAIPTDDRQSYKAFLPNVIIHLGYLKVLFSCHVMEPYPCLSIK